MNTNRQEHVSSEETIVRLLNREWIVNGTLVQTAFQLRNGETYLSVNRPAVESYEADVASFVDQHPKYRTMPHADTYQRACLNVGEVRGIDIMMNGHSLGVDVDVEPRNVHAKSHAGIFTRIKGNNVKGGQTADVVTNSNGVFSATMILQKMRWKLLSMAKVETCGLAFDK